MQNDMSVVLRAGKLLIESGADALAMEYFRSCFVTAFTIAIAISIVQQIPLSFFIRRKMIK